MTEDQWKQCLAPGVLPASEEAVEWFQSGARGDGRYEAWFSGILEDWPVCDEPSIPLGASWSSKTKSPEDLRVALLNEQPKRGDDDIPF